VTDITSDDPLLRLCVDDLLLINNALNEIINGPAAIAQHEFQTRTGATIAEAALLLSRIGRAIDLHHAH
jgi:hypothetical protein